MAVAYGEKWFVSPYNFDGTAAESEPASFLVHDTTLRDGEQQAGVIFTADEKVAIGTALAELGVDRIEAGMVAVSEDDRQAIAALVEAVLACEVWTIARSLEADIRAATESGVDGVGIIILANEQYCSIFGWSVEEAIDKAVRSAELARNDSLQTTLLVADSSRMGRATLADIAEAASASGHFTSLALMDTFGALSPTGAANLVLFARTLTDLPIELHAHNDFGLATANALAGIGAGASVVHTSMLGLGERVGNTPLEELAVSAPLLYGYRHRLKLDRLVPTAELVARSARVTTAANKAIVGSSYAQIESGTVAAEYTRWTRDGNDLQWLFPFDPRLVGGPDVELILGKGSGVANVEQALARNGVTLDTDATRELLSKVKAKSIELHRPLTDEEFRSMTSANSG